jgi:hypothetical protein
VVDPIMPRRAQRHSGAVSLQADLRFIHTLTQRPDQRFEQVGDVYMLANQQAVNRRHEIVELRLRDVLTRFPAEGVPEFVDDLSGQLKVVVRHGRFS